MARQQRFDVVVAGGGAAGVAAAVGAARSGASVCLLEQYGFLGGAATNSSVLAFCGFFDQNQQSIVAGVGAEILTRLKVLGVYREQLMGSTGNRIVLLDSESTKVVLDEALHDEGVQVRLHSELFEATTEENQVASVRISHRGGSETMAGGAFIDATGDGALINLAGAEQLTVVAEQRQTSTLTCLFGGVPEGADLSREGMSAAVDRFNDSVERELRDGSSLVRRSGIAVRLPVTGQIMALLVDEHFDTLDVEAFSQAERRARRQARRYLDAFRAHLAGWQGAFLVQTGPQMGIRESRRLQGIMSITVEDVLTGRKRPGDSVGRCGWPVEDHPAPGVTEYTPIAGRGWYDIPYGAIRSANVDNLWSAGRLISATGRAFASSRVMGTAFATGHAAGVAAALHVAGRPHDVAAIRRELVQQGALI